MLRVLTIVIAAGLLVGPSVQRHDKVPCPTWVRIFDGQTWNGWVADYGSFRLIVTSRMAPVNKDHLGVLFWGPHPADGSLLYDRNLQVQPPHGAMWDYFDNKDLPGERLVPVSRAYESWNTMEILADISTGTLRVAVNGVEVRRYTVK